MNTSVLFIGVAITVLAVVAILAFFIGTRRNKPRLTPLASLAFGFIVAGVLFGNERLVGYGLMGIGVLLAVIDIFHHSRST